MNIAFFDFDGTITTKDTLLDFIRFCVGDTMFFIGLIALSPMLIRYKLKFIPNNIAKERMLSYFFNGIEETTFRSTAQAYATEHIDRILRPEAMNAIHRHQHRGDKVVIVSASIECWIKPWCEKHSLDLISTKLQFVQGLATGKLLTPNCYGQEKANRIRAQYDLTAFETVYAYGDTRGDKEMLDLAHSPYYKSFKQKAHL